MEATSQLCLTDKQNISNLVLSCNFTSAKNNSSNLVFQAVNWTTIIGLLDVTTLTYAVISLASIYGLYWLFFVPLDHIRGLTQFGYEHLEDESKKRKRNLVDMVNDMRFLQKRGEVPPIYPNGWFVVYESMYLKRGEVKSVSALGQSFAVFRTMDGKAHVFDAYCPHMGANVGIGGKVVGNCIQCPFHKWQFNAEDGQCTKIPYSKEIPTQLARMKRWDTLEINGYVHVWYHAEKESPTWYPYEMEEINQGKFALRARTENIINNHVQDIAENGVDMAHFEHIHTKNVMAGANLHSIHKKYWQFALHEYTATWSPCEAPNTHMSTIKLTHTLRLLGLRMLKASFDIDQVGPSLVYFKFNTAFGSACITMTATPLGPLEMRVLHHFYASPFFPAPIAKFFMLGEIKQFERDVQIFNSKRYRVKPMLMKEERLIPQHRRWYSQFYSENSPRFNFSTENSCW